MGFLNEFFVFKSVTANIIVAIVSLVIAVVCFKIEKKRLKLIFHLFLLLYSISTPLAFYNHRLVVGFTLAVAGYIFIISGMKKINKKQLENEVKEILKQEIKKASPDEKFTEGDSLIGHPAVDQLRRTQNIQDNKKVK